MRDSPDASEEGAARAIPVEFVKGILEVKAAFNHRSSSEALNHLADLDPLLAKVDLPGERYPSFLQPSFFRSMMFLELRDRDRRDSARVTEETP